jgi:hypothetical protein
LTEPCRTSSTVNTPSRLVSNNSGALQRPGFSSTRRRELNQAAHHLNAPPAQLFEIERLVGERVGRLTGQDRPRGYTTITCHVSYMTGDGGASIR